MCKAKTLIISLFVGFMTLCSCINVYALEYDEDLEADEDLETITYAIDCVSTWTKWNNPTGYYTTTISTGQISITGYQICMYRTENERTDGDKTYSHHIFIYNKNGVLRNGDVDCALSTFPAEYCTLTGTTETGVYNGNDWYDSSKNPYTEYDYLFVETQLRIYESADFCKLNTTIPIFDSEESAWAFMSDDGTVSIQDAINYESDISNIVYDLETPQDLQCTTIHSDSSFIDEISFNVGEMAGDLSFKWNQTDPNYVDWTTEVYCYITMRYRSTIGLIVNFYESPWTELTDEFFFFDTVDTYKLYWDNWMDASLQGIRDLQLFYDYDDYEFDTLTFYIRNYYYDEADAMRHYSNWVLVEYDVTSGKIVTSTFEVEGSEVNVDDDGNVTIGDSSVVSDSQYNGLDYELNTEQASTDILGWINGGFGLLGNNGLISMISEAFSFVPSEIWSIFVAGIGIMVLIAVLKLVF